MGVFLLILIIGLTLQSGVKLNFKKEIQSFEVVDSCGLIAGEILHEFNDEGGCKLRCENLCGVRDLNYVSHDFSNSSDSCYGCECNCK